MGSACDALDVGVTMPDLAFASRIILLRRRAGKYPRTMDLERMLQKCRRDQWSIDDLDWDLAPPELPREKEEAVVQCFTDMAAIELLAGALFEAQRKKTDDPTLQAILSSFVADEQRHSAVAARLARHYDVHRWRAYSTDEHLLAFRPHFLAAIEQLAPEIANAYITTGELLLDVALLRSLDDYVDDEMSHRAMYLINRDESRHIAVDFHMTEIYSSEQFLAASRRRPRRPWRQTARGAWTMANVIWRAGPFLRNVFLRPMDRTDPSGKRLREAFKRIQLVSNTPAVARLPLTRFLLIMQAAYNHPLLGRLAGPLILRLMSADDRFARVLYTDEELARARQMSFDELAEDVLAAKYA
jgi:hypothetical protein